MDPTLAIEVLGQIPTDCEGCGWCCEHTGSPPLDDLADLGAMPEALARELTDYRQALVADPLAQSREVQGLGCLWWDPAARRCRHHDHKPPQCRRFEIGGQECLDVRTAKLIELTGGKP